MTSQNEDAEYQISIIQSRLKVLSMKIIPENEKGPKNIPSLFNPEYISGDPEVREIKFTTLKNNWEAELKEVRIKFNKEINFSQTGEFDKGNVRIYF